MASYSMDKVFGLESRKNYMGIARLWIIGYHCYSTLSSSLYLSQLYNQISNNCNRDFNLYLFEER